jgi:hypothetical protein
MIPPRFGQARKALALSTNPTCSCRRSRPRSCAYYEPQLRSAHTAEPRFAAPRPAAGRQRSFHDLHAQTPADHGSRVRRRPDLPNGQALTRRARPALPDAASTGAWSDSSPRVSTRLKAESAARIACFFVGNPATRSSLLFGLIVPKKRKAACWPTAQLYRPSVRKSEAPRLAASLGHGDVAAVSWCGDEAAGRPA